MKVDMLKSLFVVQTILLLFLPITADHFNKSLTFSLTDAPERAPRYFGGLHFNRPAIPFGKAMGKAIKEKGKFGKGYRIKKVVIDPGHGGHDPGCLGGRSYEKNLALAISKKLAANFKESYPGIEVIMTRDKDVFIPLHKRAEIANQNNADLFISLHCNYMPKASYVVGSETYVLGQHRMEENLEVAMRENASVLLEDNYEANYGYDPNSPEGHIMLSMFQNAYLEQSILFAEKVEHKMQNSAKRNSRGVKQAGFLVLRATAMPSVLIETGFLSNAKEERYLKTEAGQQQVANAILAAFQDYKNELEGVRPSEADIATTKPIKPAAVFKEPEQEPKKVLVQKSAPATPPPAAPVAKENPSVPATIPPHLIQFRVQLAASPTPLDISQPIWQNLDYLIQVSNEAGMYKYQARNLKSFDEAISAKNKLKQIGFPDAFVVAYYNGQRINVDKAKQLLGIQ
jgi:N-acetylmuramoyl-L-alanine amidase